MAPRIVLHLHPGWPHAGGTVLEGLLASGSYRNQWETGTSNGGLTAHVGGDRWRWESRLFAGRYDASPAADRPVYGAWQRRDDPWGAAPRFGSAYVVLRPEVVERSTCCWPDSVRHRGTARGPEALPELGRLADAARDEGGVDPLDDYVEAHVHGGVDLARDVEALVLDPSDRQEHAEVLGRLGCAVQTHPGYAVEADDVDPGYRGPSPVRLARRVGGVLTPARLAQVARSGRHDPQDVKWLWHCLARFGRLAPTPTRTPGRVVPGATARLRFREMGEGDLDLVAGLLGDPEVMRFYPRPKTRDEALEWIRWSMRNYAEHGHGLWIVETHAGEFVGDCGLTWQPVGGERVLEVGYHVVPALQGRGYASEAARACLDLATGPLGHDHVVAIVVPDNAPSRRVAEKIGLRLEQETEVHGRPAVVLGTAGGVTS